MQILPLLLTKIRKINFMDAETILMSSGGEQRHAINSSLLPEKKDHFKYQFATSIQGEDGNIRRKDRRSLNACSTSLSGVLVFLHTYEGFSGCSSDLNTENTRSQ